MKKNLAIVGYGGQGAWHANWAMKSDVVSLAGIYDIDGAKRDKARANGIKVYESLDEVIAIALEPDLKTAEYSPVESAETEGQSVRKALKS